MCDQMPDEILLHGRRVAIAPLPVVENESVDCAPEEAIFHTGNARGYVAYWLLSGERLYLVEAKGRYRVVAKMPVFADWVSGTIRPPDGSYGDDFLIHVDNGVVLS